MRERVLALTLLGVAMLLPALELLLPKGFSISPLLIPVLVYAILALGLNVVTGFTGLLNLGIAAFMAIGAYWYAILSCEIYPFQLGFWLATLVTIFIGASAGFVLGLPTLRLRGDYLAVVTLGFGEIVQDVLKNLEVITKGTQGINPLPQPNLFGFEFSSATPTPWYYLLLAVITVIYILLHNLENSRVGREWMAVRNDELAASCMGINPVRTKLYAFALGAALASLAGALWAAFLGSTGEPGNYDFQVSVIALCILIVGGLGRLNGVIVGALVMVGFNSIVLVKLTAMLADYGLVSTQNVFTTPNNWKYMVFGLALVLMMRFRPDGIIGESKRC